MKQSCALIGNGVCVNPEKYVVVYESDTLPVESGSKIPEIDILFTNIPLQYFSVASQDKREVKNPFDDIMTIVKDKKPQAVILENVSGMPLYREGRTFKDMCKAMNDAGYIVSQEHDMQSGRFYVKAERMK